MTTQRHFWRADLAVISLFLLFLIFASCENPTKSGEQHDNMVFVEGGLFRMGDTFETGYSNGKPVHQVGLDDFYMAPYELTQAEWMEYADTNMARHRGDSLPIVNVDWFDVFMFCNLKSIAEGLDPCYWMHGDDMPADLSYIHTDDLATHPEKRHERVFCDFSRNGYRLPTEAEWEYAARGGLKSQGYRYAGSDDPDAVAWYWQNSGDQMHAGGLKAANELGLYDMSGNVCERVWDWYMEYSNESAINPCGAQEGGSRMIRGGSFAGGAMYCEVSYRYPHASTRLKTTGFRLCRSARR